MFPLLRVYPIISCNTNRVDFSPRRTRSSRTSRIPHRCRGQCTRPTGQQPRIGEKYHRRYSYRMRTRMHSSRLWSRRFPPNSTERGSRMAPRNSGRTPVRPPTGECTPSSPGTNWSTFCRSKPFTAISATVLYTRQNERRR